MQRWPSQKWPGKACALREDVHGVERYRSRNACPQRAMSTNWEPANADDDQMGGGTRKRQLEVECELPRSLPRPFANPQCECMPAGSWLGPCCMRRRPAKASRAGRVVHHTQGNDLCLSAPPSYLRVYFVGLGAPLIKQLKYFHSSGMAKCHCILPCAVVRWF